MVRLGQSIHGNSVAAGAAADLGTLTMTSTSPSSFRDYIAGEFVKNGLAETVDDARTLVDAHFLREEIARSLRPAVDD